MLLQISYQFIITLFHTCFVSFDGIVSDKLSCNIFHIMTSTDSLLSHLIKVKYAKSSSFSFFIKSTQSFFYRFNQNELVYNKLQILPKSLMCCKTTNFILKPDILCLKISEKENLFLIFADF